MAFSFSIQPAQAQTVNCPVGYTCTPVTPQPTGCPAGYTCTPVAPSPNTCYTFSRNIGVGSSGQDVQQLTSVLTSQGFLSGSTSQYDESVAAAVTSFQEKYSSDVLVPNGLSNGTGYVGRATRSKLNQLCGVTSPVTYPTPQPTPVTNNRNNPVITSVGSPANPASSFYPGDRVTIVGSGLPINATVWIGSTSIVAQSNATGYNITFYAPSTISPGTYNLYVTGPAMQSNTVSVTVLSANSNNAPIISGFNGKAGSLTAGSSNYVAGQYFSGINSAYLVAVNNPGKIAVVLGYTVQSDSSAVLSLPTGVAAGQYYLYVSTPAATSQPFAVDVSTQ